MSNTIYRCVTGNGNDGSILCIGIDENQGGEDYNGIGKWCSFTFQEIPQPTEEITLFMQENNFINSIIKVADNAVVLKTVVELQEELANPPAPEAPVTPPADETPATGEPTP